MANTATLRADNGTSSSDRADVRVEIPREVDPVVTKSWTDGSAVAGSGEASEIVVRLRNASSSTAQVSQLAVEDSSAEVFERFDVTGVGPVAFPAGADRVTVLACTTVLSACDRGDYVASPPQAGPGVALPAGACDLPGVGDRLGGAAQRRGR